MGKSSRNNPKSKSGRRESILIERSSLVEINFNKAKMAQLRDYHWRLHSELASQRNDIQDELKMALLATSANYSKINLQRTVKYKYGLHPLSVIGSTRDIGGRFNVGTNINQDLFSFPGLYLAEDKDTSLQEHLGQVSYGSTTTLTSREIALTSADSETTVSVSVDLETVFDLTNMKNLTPFTDLIKKFKISRELIAFAKKNKMDPILIRTNAMLQKTLLEPRWRQTPGLFDLPSASQIFGHLVYLAGIQGVLYNSNLTRKECLVIFPRNFVDTDSYIVLDHQPPHGLVPTKIDKNNWEITEKSFDDIIESQDF